MASLAEKTFKSVTTHAVKTGAPTTTAGGGVITIGNGVTVKNGVVYKNGVPIDPYTGLPNSGYKPTPPVVQRVNGTGPVIDQRTGLPNSSYPNGAPNDPTVTINPVPPQVSAPPPQQSGPPAPDSATLIQNQTTYGQQPPGTGTDPAQTAVQQQIADLVKNFNAANSQGFNVTPQTITPNYITQKQVDSELVDPYANLVTPSYVTPSLLANPFGPKGYQPPTQYENSLLNDINSRTSNNYLGAFLPEAIKQAKALFGNEYGAQIVSQLLNAAQQQNTIQSYNTGANQLLSQLPDSINQDFGSSIALQRGLDRGISQELAGLNPNNAAQAGAAASPDQVANINAQNKESFNTSGAVLGGIGDLNASSLGAQRAAVLASVRQLPLINSLANRQALVANQIGNSNALAKLQTAQAHDVGTAAEKIAGQDLSANQKGIDTDTSLYKTFANNDEKYIAQQIGWGEKNNAIINVDRGKNADIANATRKTNAGIINTDKRFNSGIVSSTNKANAAEKTRVDIATAANALSAIRISNSERNTLINQTKLALSIIKASNPTATPAQQASQAKAAASFFGQASGSNPKIQTQVVLDKNGQPTRTSTGGYATAPQAVGRLNYDDAVRQYATAHNIPTGQAQAIANGYYNIGQGGRPLDPGMAKTLQSAGLDPQVYHTKAGIAFLTTDQMAALAKAGYGLFTNSVISTQQNGPGKASTALASDLLAEGVVLPRGTDPNSQVPVWSIRPFNTSG